MNTISLSAFKLLRAPEIKKEMPFTVLIDGEPEFVVVAPEGIIVIQDLHIRVRNMLKALEKRARIGMPKPERIDYRPTS